MSSTGPLAEVLRAVPNDDLVRGLKVRGIPASGNTLGGLRDFYDLADALLSADSLQHCLTRLDRHSLAVIVELGSNRMTAADIRASAGSRDHHIDTNEDVLTRLRDLFLLHETPDGITVWPEVLSQLAGWPTLGLPAARDDATEPGGTAADGDQHSTDALGAEQAFASTTAMAELLFELEREPLRLLATGALGRPSSRKLAELLRVQEKDVSSFVDVAEHAGLVSRNSSHLAPSAHHRKWLEGSPAERWAVMADAWAQAHWPDIRGRIANRHFAQDSGISHWLEWNYPGGRDWLSQDSAMRLSEAELLGITARGSTSTLGSHLLAGDIDTAKNLLTATLPTPVERLYLQHDLTAVATGPLHPRIDTRLRTMADVDGHTIASRYRFTNASITRAVSGQETATTILEFLESITLSGIPQPLEYLVTETASRHGLLRVGPLPVTGPHAISYIRSDDEMLLRTVLIDRNLAALRMRPRDSEYLVSACERDQLYRALYEAKYPVAMEDSDGHIVATRPIVSSGGAAPKATVPAQPHSHLALVTRLRIADENAPEDSAEAWLARQLDSAIRSKSAVVVSVRMPNGNLVDYELEPASVSGGRLRARDPRSDIERTLPLSSIAAVRDA